MAAAKAAAARTGDLSSHLVTNNRQDNTGGVNVLGPSIMHAYSVGQKSKKKDPKPEEQRPGDWQCECGNCNFAWRKECNACGKKKPFNKIEEDSKKAELERIKAEREKRRAAARGGGGRGRDRSRDRSRLDPDDLRKVVDRDRNRGGRDRDRSRDRRDSRRDRSSTRDSRRDRSKDRGRDRDKSKDRRDRDSRRDKSKDRRDRDSRR